MMKLKVKPPDRNLHLVIYTYQKDFQVNIPGIEISETNELGEKILNEMCIAAAAAASIQLNVVGSMDFLMEKHHELQS